MTPPALAGKKVAHLTTVASSLEYLLLPQLLRTIEAGAEVIGISAPGPSVERLEALGIRHIALSGSTRGMNLSADCQAAAELYRILRRERPDVLHTHNPKPGVYGRIGGHLARVPVVVNTVHGLYATEDASFAKRALVYSLEAIASRFSDAELVQNEEDFELLRRWRISPPRRLHFLGNGVDLNRFSPRSISHDRRSALRSRLGLRNSSVVVGIVARLVHDKGYRELIAAAEGACGDISFLAVGAHDPEKGDALTAGEIARGERARVQFLGHRDDIRDLYAAMDIVVLPSYREGVPRSLMEGAAMGKPLVATNVRGCRQVVVEGFNGLLVPAADERRLLGAIESLAHAPGLRSQMGIASRQVALRNFDEAVVVDRVLQITTDCLSRLSH